MKPDRPMLLRARWIAPMDRPPIRDGAVVSQNGRIIDIDDAATIARRFPSAEHHDLGDVALLPGLINPHVHLELSDTPRLSDRWDGTLADWLIGVMKSAPPPGDRERVTHAVEIGIRQCLRFGVTTVGDITRQPSLTRPLLQNGPLRVISFGEVQAMAGRRSLLESRLAAAVDRSFESDRVRVGVSPHAPYSIEPAGYARCQHVADDVAMPLTIHLAESADEATFLRDHSGSLRRIWDFLDAWTSDVPTFAGGPIRLMKSLGLLDRPTLLAHVNHCDDAELQILAGGKAGVVYCPRTHAYFGHPPHRWRDMLAAGINVSIGTDSLASSPDLNLVDDLRLLRRLAPDLPANDLWQLATTRAAWALGLSERVGSLSIGKRADFLAFPVSEVGDPLESVLNESVWPDAVWIDGQCIDQGD